MKQVRGRVGHRPTEFVLRLAGFGLVPVLSMVGPFFVLPVIARSTNTAEWVGLGVGQSIGMLAAVIVSIGWPLSGPSRMATAGGPIQQLVVYSDSVRTRGAMCLMTLPVVTLAAILTAPQGAANITITVALSFTATGLAPTWAFVGMGRPWLGLLIDTLPRATISAAAAIAILNGIAVTVYPYGILLSVLLSVFWMSSYMRVSARRVDASRRRTWAREPTLRCLRRQVPAALGSAMSGVYTVGAVGIASIVLETNDMAELTSADRLMRMMQLGSVIAVNTLTNVVVRAELGTTLRRRAMFAVGAVGAGLASITIFLGSAICALLFGEDLAPDGAMSAFYGVTLFLSTLSMATIQHVAAPQGKFTTILQAHVAAASVFLLGAHPVAATWGGQGVAGLLAVSQGVTLAILSLHLRTSQANRCQSLGDVKCR